MYITTINNIRYTYDSLIRVAYIICFIRIHYLLLLGKFKYKYSNNDTYLIWLMKNFIQNAANKFIKFLGYKKYDIHFSCLNKLTTWHRRWLILTFFQLQENLFDNLLYRSQGKQNRNLFRSAIKLEYNMATCLRYYIYA